MESDLKSIEHGMDTCVRRSVKHVRSAVVSLNHAAIYLCRVPAMQRYTPNGMSVSEGRMLEKSGIDAIPETKSAGCRVTVNLVPYDKGVLRRNMLQGRSLTRSAHSQPLWPSVCANCRECCVLSNQSGPRNCTGTRTISMGENHTWKVDMACSGMQTLRFCGALLSAKASSAGSDGGLRANTCLLTKKLLDPSGVLVWRRECYSYYNSFTTRPFLLYLGYDVLSRKLCKLFFLRCLGRRECVHGP